MVKSSQRGFTLIEVMVAVAVVAVALPALTMAMLSQIDGTAYLRDKMQAHWVAENKMAEVRIKNRIRGVVSTAVDEGVEELAGREWRWQVRSQAFASEEFSDIFGVEVTVWRASDAEDDPYLVQLFGTLQYFKTAAVIRPDAQQFSGTENDN